MFCLKTFHVHAASSITTLDFHYPSFTTLPAITLAVMDRFSNLSTLRKLVFVVAWNSYTLVLLFQAVYIFLIVVVKVAYI